MLKSKLIFAASSLITALTLSQCASPGTGTQGEGGMDGTAGAGNSAGSGSAGTTGVAGNTSGNAGTTGTGNTTGAAGAAGAAGRGGAGNATGTAGTTGNGGATGVAGATGVGGAAGRGGTTGAAGTTGGRGGMAGGAAGRGGTTGTAGATGGGGGMAGAAGTGVRTDMGGVPLARPGDMTNVSRGYLNLGDMRLINNRWGSDELGCSGTTQRVFVNSDRTIGWEFNRPACGLMGQKPDYPEVEFGVGPFGATNPLLTTPAFSSTTLLPKQIKDITSAAITYDSMTITLQRAASWNINFEVWFSMRNPLTDPNPDEFAEIMGFFGWETGRWPCDQTGNINLTSASQGYTLCHQSDTWAENRWRYYQFNINNGPLTTYSNRVDVKAFVDWIVSRYSLSRDLWLTRIEVGSEIGDNTQGSVRIRNLTFEINGTSKSIELAP